MKNNQNLDWYMQLFYSGWCAQAAGTAVKFNFADHLASGPKSVDELATLTNTHAPTVHRLLRGLASLGVFVEQEPGRFANTPLSDSLRTDYPDSVRPVVDFLSHDMSVMTWGDLPYSVQTGKTSFEHVFGAMIWDYLGKHPDHGAVFDAAMSFVTASMGDAVARGYDFSGFETICDVAGGRGLLLGSVLAQHRNLRGILFDRPPVVATAGPTLESAGVAARCQVVGGNFFETLPEASAYMVKSILHDWDDEHALKLLKSIHRAAKPGSKFLAVEAVIQPGNGPDPNKFFDLQLLLLTKGGRERTEQEFRQLFTAAGFELTRVIPLEGQILSILEAVRT